MLLSALPRLGMILFTISVPLFASDWSCSEPSWPEEPVVESNKLRGTIVRQCVFNSPDLKENYSDLTAVYEEELMRQADEIFSGPTETFFQGIPAIYWDARQEGESDGNKVDTRYDVHIAIDVENLYFLFDMDSTDVKGEGTAKNIEKLTESLSIEPSTGDEFYIQLSGYIEVKKPLFVSPSLLKSIVKRNARKGMETRTQQMRDVLVSNF